METLSWGIAFLLAYLCGSIPFGLLIGRAHHVDLRTVGSGNIGATNCGRVLGRKWGAICLILDLFKGLIPVLAAGWWFGLSGAGTDVSRGQEWAWLGVATAAVIGHIFPVWLGFRGGKGVATGLGVILGVYPWLTLPAAGAAGTWLILVGMFRYVGLASVVAAVLLPGYVLVGAMALGHVPARATPYMVMTGAIAVLILIRHRSNLARTWAGTESRVGRSSGRSRPTGG